ncbi:MAG: TetR/AcrR family transcriptional regulator [Ardenticatenaceae bacterium]|nr:TetR/AcrR family transcriptional regulator [Anaerolineales bacterium]MCB8979851.1 TetR/AcrR family transcriptional regulator [Ardenticatenaceae bacterium]
MKNVSSAKEKLFQTAVRLFYQRGYQATGVDTIAAESSVGKMTLYRHFPSKDDLIVAFLHASDEEFWAYFESSTAQVPTAREKLQAFFEALQAYTLSPDCYGCPFLNVATEFPERTYAGHQVAIAHKQVVRERFMQLTEEAGARQPEALANALMLLMDGAYMAARMFGSSPASPAANVAEAARHLIDAYC